MENMNKSGRILMVEDDAKDVELTLTALEEYNFANEVLVTRDGEQALDYLHCRGQYQTRSPEPCAAERLPLRRIWSKHRHHRRLQWRARY
jgi:hypothetical protein